MRMKKIYFIIALLAFTVTQFIIPSVSFAQETELSSADRAAIALTLERGQKIYRYDQAAWHSSDTLRKDIKDINNSGIRGWVVTEVGDDLLTTYWRRDGDGYAGVYSAVWTGSKIGDRRILSDEAAKLSAEQIKLIKASAAVRADQSIELTRCSDRPFNSVVMLGNTADDPILYYYLTPQSTLDAIPLGGHYRFLVKDDKVISHRKFTNSCISLPTGDKDKKPEAITISHLLDAVPTEIHVFSVYAAKLPLYVITTSNENLWVVEISSAQPRIRKLK